MFDFYPHGISGLVADFLIHHVRYPDGSPVPEQNEVERVIDLYQSSAQYQLYLRDPEGEARERLTTVLLHMLYSTLWDFVRYHRTTLTYCRLYADAIHLGTAMEYILLERV